MLAKQKCIWRLLPLSVCASGEEMSSDKSRLGQCKMQRGVSEGQGHPWLIQPLLLGVVLGRAECWPQRGAAMNQRS